MSAEEGKSVFEPEKPAVPDDWSVAPFSDVVEVISDKGKRTKQREYLAEGRIPVIDQGQDFIGGYIDNEGMAFDGDLPIIVFGDHTRAVKYVKQRFAVGADGVKLLKPTECYDSKFFYYLLKSLQIPSRGYSRHFQFLKKFHLPIAPIDQQKRIVAEIEKQFSRLDEAVANLKRVKANLKRYKAAVLKAAVEGKLTEEWRKQHLPAPSSVSGKFYTYAILCDDDSIYIGHTDDIERRWSEHRDGQGAEWTQKHKPVKIAHYEEHESRKDAAEREKWLKTGFGRKWLKRELAAGRTRQAGDVEPADKLLERILAERREKWQGRGKYKEPVAPDTTALPELPEGWVWVRLDAITAIKGGITVDKKRKDPTARLVPYLRVANVQRGYLDLSEMKEIEAPLSSIEDLRLLPGDILFNEGGDRDKLGRGWVWEGQIEDCIHQNHVFRARPYLNEMNSKLISWWGNSFGQYYFLRVGKQTTNLASINMTKLSELPVPFPPFEEQAQIEIEVERLLSVVVGAEGQVDANLRRTDRLRQSILKKAFSGQLALCTEVLK